MWTSAVNSGAMHSQKVRIVGEQQIERRDEHPDQLSYEVQGEPARILERGMPNPSPNALADYRIGGGHPEGLFEAWAYPSSPLCAGGIHDDDRDDRAFLEHSLVSGRRSRAARRLSGEQCVNRLTLAASGLTLLYLNFPPRQASPLHWFIDFYQLVASRRLRNIC